MILRFSAENFRSFREKFELSFVSTARKDEPSLRFPSQHAAHGVLPVVGVWGANASGKSNILAAMSMLKYHVQSSFVGVKPDSTPWWTPWALRVQAGDPPTTMEVELLVEPDTRIHFGFRQDSRGFIEEWLYRWQGSRRQVLYHRDRLGEEPWYFGSALLGARSHIAQATRDNCLFLSAAAQFNHPQLRSIYASIVAGIHDPLPFNAGINPLFSPNDLMLTPQFHGALMRILSASDLGVIDIKLVEERSATEIDALLAGVADDMVQEVRRSLEKKHVELGHRTDTDPWRAPARYESQGTHTMLAQLSNILLALHHGMLLVVDEFNASLQPDLGALLISIFTDKRTNTKGAQMLFATHDRDLLTGLRSDEIVLVDKDHFGASTLHYASDYKGVRTRADLRRAHEAGQLRGVPVLGDIVGELAAGLAHAE